MNINEIKTAYNRALGLIEDQAREIFEFFDGQHILTADERAIKESAAEIIKEAQSARSN